MISPSTTDHPGSVPVALLRITVGVILVVTWYDNLTKDLYTADGFSDFLEFLGSPEGNGGSLGFFHSILDAVVIPASGFFGAVQLVVELVIGFCLIIGLCSRLVSAVAAGFFFTLFLAYFGGNEWIWIYVLLFMATVTVYLGYGGRRLGIDELLFRDRGGSPAGNHLW